MGRLLKVLGLAFLVLIVMFAALLFWAARTGSKYQDEFFKAVASGRTEPVLALMAPTLRADVDEPLLAAWIKLVNTRLGPYQGLRKTDFQTASRVVDNATVTESSGTVDFQHGSAKSQLVFRDGQLAGFYVQAEQIASADLMPASTALYRERGQQFLTHLVSGDPAQAFAMMHEELKKAVPLEKLEKSVPAVREQGGPLQSITWEKDELDASHGQRLKVFYKVQMAKQAKQGMVAFQFRGFKGHLVAFELGAPDENSKPASK
jgi:hypothetical protein